MSLALKTALNRALKAPKSKKIQTQFLDIIEARYFSKS